MWKLYMKFVLTIKAMRNTIIQSSEETFSSIADAAKHYDKLIVESIDEKKSLHLPTNSGLSIIPYRVLCSAVYEVREHKEEKILIKRDN